MQISKQSVDLVEDKLKRFAMEKKQQSLQCFDIGSDATADSGESGNTKIPRIHERVPYAKRFG